MRHDNKEQLRTLLRGYVISGLTDPDKERFLQYVDDEIIGIGIGEQGIVNSKDDMRRIIIETRKSQEGVSYEITFEQEDFLFHSEYFATACAKVLIKTTTGTNVAQSGLFQSALFKRTGTCWKICNIAVAPLMISTESIEAYPLKFAEQTLSQIYKQVEAEALELLNANIASGIVASHIKENTYPCYFVNEGLLKLLGYTRDEFYNKFSSDVTLFIHPLDRELIKEQIQTSLEKYGEYQKQMRLMRKDGSEVWVFENCRLTKAKDNTPLALSVFTDITTLINLQKQLEGQTALLEEQAAELTAQNEELIAQSTALAEKTNELQISEERFHIMLKNTNKIIFDYDITQNKIIYASNLTRAISLEPTVVNIQQILLENNLLEPTHYSALNDLFETIKDQPTAKCVLKSTMNHTKDVWYKISMKQIAPVNEIVTRAIGLIEDITKQKKAEIAHAHEEKYRQLLLEKSVSSYTINFSKNLLESHRINHPDCIKVTVGDSYDNFIETLAKQQLKAPDRLAFTRLFSCRNIIQSANNGNLEFVDEFEFLLKKRPIVSIWLKITLRLYTDSTSGEVKGLLYFSNIDKQKRELLELAYKSEHDSLTGLYNKGATEAHIKAELEKLSAVSTGIMMLLDIDHFKALNDTYGHPFGDKILTRVANTINEQFRDTDIIGRIGGDEFCVFFYGIRSQQQITSIAQKICKTIAALSPSPDPKTPDVSCSIGISGCYGTYKNFATLYKEADTALYKAKALGRNCYVFFCAENTNTGRLEPNLY